MRFLLLFCLVTPVFGDTIRRLHLNSQQILDIAVSTNSVTTIALPAEIQSLSGYRITSGTASDALFVFGPTEPRKHLTLRCLHPGSEVLLTVGLHNTFQVFRLTESSTPDVLVTVTGSTATEPLAILRRRQNHNTDRYIELIRLAREEPVLRTSAPNLYDAVRSRDATYDRVYDTHRTRLLRVHYFSNHQAFVFEAQITNLTETKQHYDPKALRVRIGSSSFHPILTDATGSLPAKSSESFYIVLDNSRDAFAFGNEFYLATS